MRRASCIDLVHIRFVLLYDVLTRAEGSMHVLHTLAGAKEINTDPVGSQSSALYA